MRKPVAVSSILLGMTLVVSVSAKAATSATASAPLPTCTPSSFSESNIAAATTDPETKVTPVAGGGKVYTYSTGEGTTISIPSPPPGFRPTDASNETLREYGYPERPTEPAALEVWQKTMGSYKSSAPPIACQGPVPPKPNAGPVFHGKKSTSENWSGFEDAAGGNPAQWASVTGRYVQANGAARESCQANAIVSSWTGLGGDPEISGNGALLQSGTDAYTNGEILPWDEAVSSEASGEVSHHFYWPQTIQAGQLVEQGTTYEPGPRIVRFYTTNITTGEMDWKSWEGFGPNYYDGGTAEFIDERPESSKGNLYPLLNFGSIPWLWGIVRGSTPGAEWVEFGKPNHYRDIMEKTGTLLAEPSLLESYHSFTDHYHNCK